MISKLKQLFLLPTLLFVNAYLISNVVQNEINPQNATVLKDKISLDTTINSKEILFNESVLLISFIFYFTFLGAFISRRNRLLIKFNIRLKVFIKNIRYLPKNITYNISHKYYISCL